MTDRFTVTEHARLSPSSAERWLQCPGSVRLTSQIETGSHNDSLYAWEGTLAHRVAEIRASLHFGLISQAKYEERMLHWRDLVIADGHSPEEMIRHADAYVELLQSFVDEAGKDEEAEILLEKRVDPKVPGSGGTADAIIIYWQVKNGKRVRVLRVHIVDYKYGRGVPVWAEDNPQLMLYGLGALEETGDGDTATVCMTVHQPRLESVSHSCVDAHDLRKWRETTVLPQAKLALGEDAYLSPSESACRWCPVAGQCTARTQYMTQRDFGNPDLLSPDALGQILDVLPDIEDWCLQVRETALRRAYYDNEDIPGYKVVMSSGRRSIKNHDAAIEALTLAGYDQSEIARVSTKTLGDLETLVGGRKALDLILGSLVVKGQGKESLVRDDDSRPAITALGVAIEDFGVVE